MHELALSQNIVDLVVERARREGVRGVSKATIEVGMAAGVEPGALRFCCDIVTADTLVQGAELMIETIALQARCRNCAARFEPADLVSSCRRCGSYARSLERGVELRVESFNGQ
jgi:hydrogenase nickel incorporation protein HypA/HybF